MGDTLNFSSAVQKHDLTYIPSEWLSYGRKSTIIAKKFIAFKTPLDNRFNAYIPHDSRWTCDMLIKNIQNLGFIIDLTDNIDQYYIGENEFIQKNIHYKKIRCQRDDEIPNDEQIDNFIEICDDFINTNPNDIIGVHCTYGLNRTGFLICTYLHRKLDYKIHKAIEEFTKARPPGINKQDFLTKLFQKFNNKQENSISMLTGMIPICSQPLLDNIRLKYQQMCGWNRQTFPGSKPVSMNYINYESICIYPYMVSWKADGTRYMMLIENENRIYMLDCNNNVFQINNLRFPSKLDSLKHLTETLVDGEFVIDNLNGNKIYQYLVFDIVIYENENISQKTFNQRFKILNEDIITVRDDAIKQGLINKNSESLSIKTKGFWELSIASKLLDPSFQLKLTHRSDGLIFQPQLDPYQFGRSSKVLKWNTENTVDFLLKIDKLEQSKEKQAFLYLNDIPKPFASMHYSPILDKYDNQIIECSYRNSEWILYRHRPDKKYPNTKATADGIMKVLERPITKQVLCLLIEENLAFKNYK